MKLLRSRSPALEATATLLSLALLVTPVLAMLQCGNIVVDGEKFDFSALNGPHSVVTTHKPPSVYELVNTTYTLDICKSLKKDGPASESCPNGARGESRPLSLPGAILNARTVEAANAHCSPKS